MEVLDDLEENGLEGGIKREKEREREREREKGRGTVVVVVAAGDRGNTAISIKTHIRA